MNAVPTVDLFGFYGVTTCIFFSLLLKIHIVIAVVIIIIIIIIIIISLLSLLHRGKLRCRRACCGSDLLKLFYSTWLLNWFYTNEFNTIGQRKIRANKKSYLFGVLVILLALLTKSLAGVIYEFCNEDFISLGRHTWRCKAKVTQIDENI